jgi:hypothetical protein
MDHLIYKNFEGTPSKIVPQITAQGYYPSSTKQILEKRLEVHNTQEKKLWFESSFTTGDLAIYDNKGNMKIVLDAKEVVANLAALTNQEEIKEYARDMYKKLDGERFSKNDLHTYAKRSLLKYEDVIKNPIWKALAGKKLLIEYAQMIFCEFKEFERAKYRMGVFAKDELRVTFDMRFNIIHRIGDDYFHNYYSDIDLRSDINNEKTNLLAYKKSKIQSLDEITAQDSSKPKQPRSYTTYHKSYGSYANIQFNS